MCRRMKPSTKTVQNRSKTVRSDLELKLLGRNIGNTSCLQGQGFYSNAKENKTKIDKWDYIKLIKVIN